MELYFFRHGETDWNVEGRIQGHVDVPLNDKGRGQARSLVPILKKLGIQALLSSDLCRASETAELIAKPLGLPVHVSEGLREVHFGRIQGLNREEIATQFGFTFARDVMARTLSDAELVQYGTETSEKVINRVTHAFIDLLAKHGQGQYQKLAVVTHGGVIRRLIIQATKDDPFYSAIPNGTLYPMTFSSTEKKFQLRNFVPWG
jgi:probable phosphoglycerate mutase